MLRVSTIVRPSDLHGLGLFADQDITNGIVIWEPDIGIDIAISQDLYETLSEVAKAFIDHYGYWSEEI